MSSSDHAMHPLLAARHDGVSSSDLCIISVTQQAQDRRQVVSERRRLQR